MDGSRAMPSAAARASSIGRSPMTTMSAGSSRPAIARQMSGPMPAGSPEVTATTARAGITAPRAPAAPRSPLLDPVLDVGAVAQLAQPLFVRLVGAAVAEHLARLGTLAVQRDVGVAPLGDFDDVKAEGRTHRLGQFADLQRVHRALELGHGVVGQDPAEIAAARRGGIVGVEPRHFGERLAL